ncbi:MAG: TetR/AcrR family transcriptional regulator [Candidatus Thiodiazotropha sp. (ex Dulcina madagascariensis)]|nr:TetR/AcrR family transcriptional regulator [Candidatus Thiodiazotropha sp. (ex Dulcina madagascariensis)]MCU7927414.1 TetR/AcrR family transcriptional regulator [Candidatus Thiodiazotropha sp. (ex Dulcina madagascariensis)]
MRNKGAAVRQRIVDTADQLFYHQGYENTSFSDIADAMGISRGNFYYHFKSKDEILNAVINARVTRFTEMLNEWDKKILDPKQRLHYYIDMQSRNQENIVSHGCPVGSLCTELAKTRHSTLVDANQMFTVFRDWLITQLKLLGLKNKAKLISMHLLARGQGIATVSNAFEDKEFLRREVKQLKQWLDVEILKVSH